MADLSNKPHRSLSQTSSSSKQSQKAKVALVKSQKQRSASPKNTVDLTSFPSLSPDCSPEGFTGQPALNRSLTNALLEDGDRGNSSDNGCGRKAALAKLTTSVPHPPGRISLFDDSILANDFPGALHLADDAHIERLIANTGAVKLVRRFARDLAQRDAEVSALRQRADARERELKRMLRSLAISNKDIERRLYALENSSAEVQRRKDGDTTSKQVYQRVTDINGLMHEAMTDEVGSHIQEALTDDHAQSMCLDIDSLSGASSVESSNNRKRQTSLRDWQDYVFGSASVSRKTSRANSIISDTCDTERNTRRPRVPSDTSTRRHAVCKEVSQRPEGPWDPMTDFPGKQLIGAFNSDNASIRSRKSSKSPSSWAIKLFAGSSQTSKDVVAEDALGGAAVTAQERNKGTATNLSGTKSSMSAVAALRRINSNTNINSSAGKTVNGFTTAKVPQTGKRAATLSSSQAGSENPSRSSTNLGPVEMDAILPLESRPPTLTHTYNNYQQGDMLTDRFGFIYDQRRKRRQREASANKIPSGRPSIARALSAFRSDISDGEDSQASEYSRPLGSGSPKDSETDTATIRQWQDHLKFPANPTELLSHTPSVGPVTIITTVGDSQLRGKSVAVGKRGSVSINPNVQPSASTSAITADHPEFASSLADETRAVATGATANENEPVKRLLEQLTDLHDSLQNDRIRRWNEFLRKVRAERRKEGEAAAASATSDRPMLDMPEVSLADGEIVGIAGLGNKGKVGRAKWQEFRSLVLSGIPVALRAKVWAECSGASVMRVPGYYDDLVRGLGGTNPDSSVVSQIDMDVYRTLTDNVFFRKGPGVSKLREILLAYARRNPEVGYCQGMNLIAASLLLIMPAAEDAFWILTSMIEIILPEHYYDHGLLASRADQVVLRQYISQVLPKLAAHLDALRIELGALTFQWFLSAFTDCLSAEALYRVWDIIFCLDTTSISNNSSNSLTSAGPTPAQEANRSSSFADKDLTSSLGGGSTFLFQVALALLKLNEPQLLSCSTPATLYTYVNHQMTNHAISIDGLIRASEALRSVVRRDEVMARRAVALCDIRQLNGNVQSLSIS